MGSRGRLMLSGHILKMRRSVQIFLKSFICNQYVCNVLGPKERRYPEGHPVRFGKNFLSNSRCCCCCCWISGILGNWEICPWLLLAHFYLNGFAWQLWPSIRYVSKNDFCWIERIVIGLVRFVKLLSSWNIEQYFPGIRTLDKNEGFEDHLWFLELTTFPSFCDFTKHIGTSMRSQKMRNHFQSFWSC